MDTEVEDTFDYLGPARDRPEVSLGEAVDALVRVLRDDMLPHHVGPRLTCMEAEAIIGLLCATGEYEAADRWIDGHSDGDDDGNDLHSRPEPEPDPDTCALFHKQGSRAGAQCPVTKEPGSDYCTTHKLFVEQHPWAVT